MIHAFIENCGFSSAGYVLWRGSFDEARIPTEDRAAIDRADADGVWITVPFEGGHGVMYMIPGADGRTDRLHRRVNWAVYTQQPPGLDFTEPTSIPPGAVTPELYAFLDQRLAESMPPEIERIMRISHREEVGIQPVYDLLPSRVARDNVLLIGDAAAVLRPHTGSGATKALQDALALEEIAAESTDWTGVLDKYVASFPFVNSCVSVNIVQHCVHPLIQREYFAGMVILTMRATCSYELCSFQTWCARIYIMMLTRSNAFADTKGSVYP